MPIYARGKGYFGKNDWKKVQYHIGHEVMCVHCNSEYVSPGEGTMMCHSCEIRYGKSDSDDIVYCENCGCRLWYEDAIIVGDNGDYLCDECASRITKTCRDCGNPYYIDDLHIIKMADIICAVGVSKIDKRRQKTLRMDLVLSVLMILICSH